MPTLIDTSLWIDFTRARSPKNLKHFIAPFILHPDAHLAEPVAFEILRHATPAENAQLTADLGRACRQAGITVGALDLLIAAVALEHSAEVVTFDPDFEKIAAVSSLQVKLLIRPAP